MSRRMMSFCWRWQWYRRMIVQRGLRRAGARVPDADVATARGVARMLRRKGGL
jgi:hypothetical protein